MQEAIEAREEVLWILAFAVITGMLLCSLFAGDQLSRHHAGRLARQLLRAGPYRSPTGQLTPVLWSGQ